MKSKVYYKILSSLVAILISSLVFGQRANLLRIVQNGKIGYANEKGEVIIPAKYLNGGEFSYGLAPVRLNGLYGYINEKDIFVIKPQFDFAYSFYKGIASVYKNGEQSFIDVKNLPFIDTAFGGIRFIEMEHSIVITKTKHYGVMNLKTKKLIVDTVFDHIDGIQNGVSVVRKKVYIDNKKDDFSWAYGVIDTNGNFIVPFGKYKDIGGFEDGYSVVSITHDTARDESVRGVIDTKGNLLFEKPLTGQTYMSYEIHNGIAIVDLYKDWIREEKGTHNVTENTYKGYINTSGVVVYSDTAVKRLNDFSCGRAFISVKGNGFKIVDNKFERIGTDTFKSYLAKGFRNNYAVAKKINGGWGLVDTNGRFTEIESRYDYEVNGIDQGTMVIGDYLFFVIENDKGDELTGITNLSGSEITPPIIQGYDPSGFKNGILKSVINNRLTYIDTFGNVIWQERKTPISLLKTYDIDYMNRGYFYAHSKPNKNDLGGFGGSSNAPKLISKGNHFASDKLSVSVNTSEIDSLEGGNDEGFYNAITVYVSNTTKDDIEFHAQDSRLYMNVQAKDISGEWKNIEYTPMSWCGNSYHTLTLEKNYYWKFLTPIYQGSFKTKLRIELKLIDPKDSSHKKDLIVYSSEYDGSINPAQFWRKIDYQSNGIMDPYNE